MVKLMAKKSKALPPAHSLEEWHAQALQRYGSNAFLVTPHTAALRIQLRYRVYKEKVRALIKKSSVKDEGSGDSDAVVGSVKNAVRERGVKGSSMALAVAYKARKESGATAAEPVGPQSLPPLVVQNSKSAASPEIARSSIQDAPVTWGSDEWTVPTHRFGEVQKQENDEDGDSSSTDTASIDTELRVPVATTKSDESMALETKFAAEATSPELEVVTGRERKFVNVMHPSWLLATIEERCAEAAASLGARGQHGAHKQLTILDVRHTVLDLLFIARSGVSENLHGRAPSTIKQHHRNLVKRLSKVNVGDEPHAVTLDEEAQRRVTRIFNALKSDMFMPAVRCLGWMLTKTWRMLFNGLHVDVESLHRVRQVLEESGNVSVVFTPTHESHLDYLIISYLCFAYGIPLPRIAAGNNLDLPFIGSFLRANGSFFIRRSFKDDQLYKDVLQNYVHELLDDGNPMEVFIEGGRSRHGRVCKPKIGFLSMFRDFVDQEAQTSGKDVLLVPISLDYDRVFEVEEYANQLLGKPKEKESLKVFFESLWDLLFLRCGHCYVRFGEPVSIKAHESLKDTAQELAVRMQTCGTVTSTAIVSALLMWKRAYATRDMLLQRTRWLVAELETRGATIAHMETAEELVDHALSVLNVRISPAGVVDSKVSFPTRALELGFYRNHLLHVFLPDMALLGAIDSLRLRSNDPGSTVVLDKAEVLEVATFIWKFLRHICRHDAVDLAVQLETLELRVPELSVSSDSVHVNAAAWRLSRAASFVLSLHWSFADSLFLATLALSAMDNSQPRAERDMLKLAQLLARELYVGNQISHAEAFCSESLKQAFEFLQEISVIQFSASRDTGARLYTLADSASSKDLEQLQQRVHSLRKPKTFLYREDQPMPEIGRAETVALVQRAAGEAQMLAERGRARGGVYASWMSH